MPITITLPEPAGGVGPGMFVQLITDTPAVIPPGAHWRLIVSTETEPTGQDFEQLLTATLPVITFMVADGRTTVFPPQRRMPADATVHVFAELRDDLETILSSGSVQSTWKPTEALYAQIPTTRSTVVQGGFTDADRALLTETQQLSLATQAQTESTVTTTTGTQKVGLGSLFSWISPDFWGKTALSGPTSCERIVYDASRQNLFNITVHVDSYPDTIVFRTPDNVYSFPDLAVLTIVHEGVIILRHGIHTLTHQVGPLPGTFWYGAAGVNAPLQPSDYFITVDWLEGVCGRLTGAHSPFG